MRRELMTVTVTTVGDMLNWGERTLDAAGVVCAQGTGSSRDEAAFIVYHVLGLDHADAAAVHRRVDSDARRRCEELLTRRARERIPAAYLLGEAWFAGLPFVVDRRVLIPRSPFAELIAGGFEPWLRLPPRPRILEIGTGSGCIAIACARAFPGAWVVATDLSREALAVARINLRRHGVGDRVALINADLLRGIAGPFDLIVSNPPYVPDRDVRDAAPEFQFEPRIALAGGEDGLDLVRTILAGAGRLLAPGGALALEVGAGAAALERAFPRLPFMWPEFEAGGDGIALLAAGDLPGDNDGTFTGQSVVRG